MKCELNQQLAGQRLKSDHPSKLWYSTASHGLIWSIEEAVLDIFQADANIDIWEYRKLAIKIYCRRVYFYKELANNRSAEEL